MCKSSPPFANVIIVHNGALGDFLLSWPAVLAIVRAFPGENTLWGGKSAYLPWAAPLGVKPALGAQRLALQELYTETEWPAVLADTLVIWFGLGPSAMPLVAERRHPLLWYIRAIPEGKDTEFVSPRQAALEALAAKGVAPPEDWHAQWGALFGRWAPQGGGAEKRAVLLFPGAGHRAKQWPPERFMALAQRLKQEGGSPEFVLGPAELERGLHEQLGREFGTRTPENFMALSEALLGCRAVCGNDCGPMHLAGMLGVPGVALFGPTAARQWAPKGLTILSSDVQCRPCTKTTADIPCKEPECLLTLETEDVEKSLRRILEEEKR